MTVAEIILTLKCESKIEKARNYDKDVRFLLAENARLEVENARLYRMVDAVSKKLQCLEKLDQALMDSGYIRADLVSGPTAEGEECTQMPESVNVIGCAGGCMDYRLYNNHSGNTRIEEWANIDEVGSDKKRVGKVEEFSTHAEAWMWLGKKLSYLQEIS